MKHFSAILFVLSCCFSSWAQYVSLPVDTALTIGTLPNGLTYILRHNEEPKGRAHFYIVQNVGAILEEDSQNGLAHFLEHMAFNGSEHFPGKGIINYMQSIGAQFGTNVNAYTSLDETVYMLRNIPVPRPSVVDSAMLIMRDWSVGISLNADEIDKERGVIREEWRTGSHAARRLWAKGNMLKYPGSQYAKRDVIGDTAVINNFDYDTLRAYYRKWYRPDQQCVIAVGDFDVNHALQALKNAFLNVPATQNPAPRVIYPILDNERPIVSIVTDREAQHTILGLEFKKDTISPLLKNSTEGYLLSLVRTLACDMINDRLTAAIRDPHCPFVNSYAYYGDIARSKDAFMVGVVPKEGLEHKAYVALWQLLEQIRRFGFTEQELLRAKADNLSSVNKLYNERNKQDSRSYMEEYKRVFLDKEPTPGIAWERDFINDAFDKKITLDIVNRTAMAWITTDNLILDISAPDKIAPQLPDSTWMVSVIDSIRNAKIEPYQEKKLAQSLLKKSPKAGKILQRKYNTTLQSTEWVLSNGVHVFLKPTDFKDDEVRLLAFSRGGTSLVTDLSLLPSAAFADRVVPNAGVAHHDALSLSRLLAGKQVSVSPFIDTYDEGFDAISTKTDISSLFELVHLYMTAPRKDKKAFTVFQNSLTNSLKGRSDNPNSAFSDSVALTLSSHDKRTLIPDSTLPLRIKESKAYKFYKQRFKSANDFSFFIVGAFSLDSIEPFVTTYLASLPSTSHQQENWRDNGVRYPSGFVSNRFSQPMTTQQTSVCLNIWTGLPYELQNQVLLQAFKDILELRYTESLREEEGGTYGAHLRCSLSDKPKEQAVLTIYFDTDPEMEERLIGIAWAEIDSIALSGPKPSDVEKVRLNLLKRFQENVRDNGWWLQTLRLYEDEGINRFTNFQQLVLDISADDIQSLAQVFLTNANKAQIIMTPRQHDLNSR